jgi:8-oxo-dGTP pyrophosphatase MutT (NUDIX family)
MKTKRLARWQTTHAVVVLCVRRISGKEDAVAMGLKTNGPVEGWVVPPGGRIEAYDSGPISAGHREVKEEVNLNTHGSSKVAEIRVSIHGKRIKVIVHVTMCTRWFGDLKNKRDSGFEWVKFVPFSKIPWDSIPTGEKKWMELVLFEGKKCVVWITCGKDRKDVRRVATRTVEGFQ